MSDMSRAIAVIGAGNLGANIAYFLSEQGVGSSICLYDPFAGRAQGKALDMIEAQPIRRALPRLRGCDSLAAVGDSKIMVVALTADMFVDAGNDQAAVHAAMHAEATNVAAHLHGYQGVVVVASPYEQELLPLFEKTTDLGASKVGDGATRLIGLGTVPHTMYAVHLISQETGIDPRQIQLLASGDMKHPKILTETVRVAGVPFSHLYPEINLDTLLTAAMQKFINDTRSNYYRIAAAAVRVVEAIDSDLHRVLPVASFAAAERYALTARPLFAIPSVVSASGVSIDPFAKLDQVHDACVAAAAAEEGAK